MGDKYISQLKSIVQENSKERETRRHELGWIGEGYKIGIKKTKQPQHEKILKRYSDKPGDYKSKYIPQEKIEAEKILKGDIYLMASDSVQKGYAMAIANKLMGSKRSMESTLLGAKVYEKIGQGYRDSVKRKLLNKFEELAKKYPDYIQKYGPIVNNFLKRNQSKKKDLEGIIVSMLFTWILAVSISFSLFNVTGNAVVNGFDTGFAGAIFLSVILITSFLIFRNKRF